jgi:arylsulfatase A-like enzyme
MARKKKENKFKIYTLLTIFLLLAVVFMAVLAFGQYSSKLNDSSEPKESFQPKDFNVVVIVIDTLRADHLQIYGYGKDTAPFLGSLSSKSAVFTHAYSASSWTAPATASIFTSVYPFQHGVLNGLMATRRMQAKNASIALNSIPGELTTMPEAFKSKGFKTYGIANNPNIFSGMGFDQGFDKFENIPTDGAQYVNQKLLEWEQEIKTGGRYFLYLHYMDPHAPYTKQSPWFKETGDVRQDNMEAYDSEISYVDGKIREMFDRFNWSENTIVIVTADHGEEFYERGNEGHGKSLYNEVLHVPLIVYYPNGEIPAERIETNVQTVDILPTLKDLAGVQTDQKCEGISLMQAIQGKEDNERPLYSYLFRKEFDTIHTSIIKGDWKFITVNQTEMLYNIKQDWGEKNNLTRENPEKALELKNAYQTFQDTATKYQGEETQTALNEEDLKQLKALGYAN